jgi:uncharacterized protein YbcI
MATDTPSPNRTTRAQSPAAQISSKVVQIVRDYTGRGPTKARTYINDDLVVCMLGDSLTKGEQKLAERGEQDSVLALRRKYQDVMREECTEAIEEITGRSVIGFMSDSILEPDLAAEIFVLEPHSDHEGRAVEP